MEGIGAYELFVGLGGAALLATVARGMWEWFSRDWQEDLDRLLDIEDEARERAKRLRDNHKKDSDAEAVAKEIEALAAERVKKRLARLRRLQEQPFWGPFTLLLGFGTLLLAPFAPAITSSTSPGWAVAIPAAFGALVLGIRWAVLHHQRKQ